MAKKHWILIATVAAGLAVGAPAAMAAPELPGIPALPAAPALPGAPMGESSGDCTSEPGTAEATSDGQAVQAPTNGLNDGNEGNCQSAGNEQGNDVEGAMAVPQ